MRNIFLLYMPLNNLEAMTHYRDTIQQRVPFERIRPFVARDLASRLQHIFANKAIAVWGSRDSDANRSKYEKMQEGDDLLIVEGSMIKLMGKVALKTVNEELSRELWQNIHAVNGNAWALIYFIANPIELNAPFSDFCSLFGYAANYQLRGFTTVGDEKLEDFYQKYDDLYSILMRRRSGQPVVERIVTPPPGDIPHPLTQVDLDEPELMAESPIISEHVRMQWTLATLGIKAGEKVWVPTADQGKLRDAYEFNEFEMEFANGIDLPKNYYENIDVVWKEEYRIDAAFEVENSTSIYSGLLRFADLNIVAPNTLYPMFIVAPANRRNRVREQLMRPSFKRLELRGKVRFLPYETVDDIDKFFANSARGVSIELIQGKSEAIA